MLGLQVLELGGMTEAIITGMPKLRIEEAAAKKQARVDSGQDTIVGVNKYVLDNPEMVDVLKIDNKTVRQKQVDRLKVRCARTLCLAGRGFTPSLPLPVRLQSVRSSRDEAKCQEVLKKITESARMDTSTSALFTCHLAPFPPVPHLLMSPSFVLQAMATTP